MCEPAPNASSTVVVNEVSTCGPANALDEFAEIRNISNQPLDISGWAIQVYDATNMLADIVIVPEGVVLQPRGNLGQFLFLQGINLTAPIDDATNVLPYFPFTAEGIPVNGGVAIFNRFGAKVDGISFSLPAFTPREATPQTPAMDQFEPSSARDIISTDTDNNRVDFSLHKRTVGALN